MEAVGGWSAVVFSLDSVYDSAAKRAPQHIIS